MYANAVEEDVQQSVAKLWDKMSSTYIVSKFSRAELLEALHLDPNVNKNRENRDDVIKCQLVSVLAEPEIENASEVVGETEDDSPVTEDDNDDNLSQPDEDEATEQRSVQNFLIKLISPDSNGKYHVKLAFQFLRAMVDTKSQHWGEYIEQSIKISRADSPDEDRGNSIVHEAAKIGCCKLLFEKYLRDNREIVNMLNAMGETPLHIAAEYGHADDVQMLLDFGAKIVKDTGGSTPLHSAALSMEPNAHVAYLLIATMPTDLQNAKISNTGDTALHCAAKNNKMTAAFIEELRPLDPLKRNFARETVFHVAAKSSNHQTLLTMLSTFSPAKYGWDIDDVDAEVETEKCQVNEMSVMNAETEDQTVEGGTLDDDNGQNETSDDRSTEVNDEERNSVIDICARSGNAEGVVALIENGADLDKGVLHTIIEGSVRHPEKINSLKEVYRKITENAILWLNVDTNSKRPPEDSGDYSSMFQRAIIYLMSKKLESGPVNQKGRNPIEYAIEIGASEMLQQILNTEGAFKVQGEGKVEKGKSIELMKYDVYDITDFIEETNSEDEEDRPKKPYLNAILDRYDEWRDTGILSQQPFATLSEPFIVTVQRLYLVLGLLQMAYMIWFSVRNIDKNYEQGKDDIEYGLFLIWPILILAANLLRFGSILVRHIRRSLKNSANTLKPSDFIITRIILALIDTCTLFAFSISVFVWFSTKSGHAESYLMSKSMVLLFGWMATFLLFAGYSKKIYVFSILLRELLVKDIFLRFGIFFAFIVVAFSTSIHVLRQLPSAETPVAVSLDTTVFQVFILSMGLGEEILTDTTSKLAPGSILYKLVFAVYMLMSAIILLNILIALMSQRFDEALRRAEGEWRFEVLTMVMDIKCFIFTFLRYPSCQSKLQGLVPMFPVPLFGNHVYCYRGDKHFLYQETDEDLVDFGRYFVFVERKEDKVHINL